jgi:hypothetical protein
MSQFRFEKHQTAASLVLSTGTIRVGHVFVVSSLTTHGGPERVGDLLNDEHGFFPFQHGDGTTGQYNRAHVVLVKLPSGLAEEELDPGYDVAIRREITLLLSTGATIDGTLLVNGPPGHERLSDYVRNTKRFWYIVTPEGTVIVNSEHIVELVEKAA